MKIVNNIQNPKRQREVITGFLGGLNAFQDETLIKDNELTEARNIILQVDGISPRPGTVNYAENGSAGLIQGSTAYYKADGTKEFIRMFGGRLQKLVGTTFTNIGSTTYNSTAETNFIQARDLLWIFNGVDHLSYYNGSTITVYVALTTPVGLSVTATGTTGSTPYSYRISAFNTVGESLACTAVAITNGNLTLNATNYNALAWTATAGATGYNIWGNKATGLTETYMGTVYTNAYNDKGQDTPSTTILPPEGNNTEGIIASFPIFAISRIFAAGDPNNKSRLYYGGVGTNLGNFSGSPEGGGWVDVFKDDGSQIRSILPFQGGVIVWKDFAIFKFSFNSSGLPQLEEITRSFGGISFRGCKHVENDIIFPAKKDGRLAFYSVGNQENYAGTVLRTNELSIKVSSKLTDINLLQLDDSCAYYYNNIYMCAVPKTGSDTNNRVWCLDTRFGAWVYWESMSPACFVEYQDTSGNSSLYYGSETTGYMVKMFENTRDDNGVAIDVRFSTKSFNQKLFNKYKRYFNPTFQFKDVNRSGGLTGEIYLDGAILSGGFTINQQTTGGAGVGTYFVGFVLPGDGGSSTAQGSGLSSDIIQEIYMTRTARSIKYNLRSQTAGLNYKFLSLAHEFLTQENRRLPSTYRSYPSS